MADYAGDLLRVGCQAGQFLGAGADEAGSQQQVFGRISTQGHFRKRHQRGAASARLPDQGAHLRRIGRNRAHGEIALRQREP